jgi:hypothetical protein
MAEVVDAIIADLIVRNLDKYEADFNRATAAHDKFARSTDKLKAQTFDLQAEGQKYKAGTNAIGAAEEGLTQRVTRTRKARADTAVAQSNRETAAAKKAAKEQADAAIAEAQREEAAVRRIRNMVAQSTSSGGVRRGSGRIASTSVPGERTGQGAIPLSVLNGGDAAGAEAEINHMLADRAKLQAALTFASKEDAAVIRDKLAELRLINQLQRAGLGDAEIAVELEKRALAVEIERAAVAAGKSKGSLGKDAEQFARGSGFYAATGGTAAVAGIATAASLAAVVAVTKEVITSGLAYAETLKQESEQLGISAHALQIWRVVAEDAGVKTEQLKEGFGQLASNIGKAQEGSQEQSKIFKALGIGLGNAKDGYKSLNDILPVFMDKLSKIPDQARRLALETALGGEQLRKLDPILSKGSGSFNEMAEAIDATGTALSNREIQRAAQTAAHLRQLNDQLQRQLAGFVATNASAIDQLATSFFRLASSAISALAALQRFGARRVLQSDMASDDQKAAAIDLLNSTPQGRFENSQSIARGAKTLATAGRTMGYGGQIYVDGLGYVDNTKEGRANALATLKQRFQGVKGAAALDAESNDTAPAGGGPDLSKIFAPKGPRGPKDKTDEQAKRFTDEMARLQDEQLRAVADQTQDELARLEIKEQQLNTDTARQKADIELQVKQKQLTRAQADALERQLNDTHNAQLTAIERDKVLEAMRRTYDAAIAELDAQEDILRDKESLAKTVKERAALEKQILEIERQKETLGANYTIDRAANDDSSVSTSDLNAANRTLKTQDKRFAGRSATIDAQNRGPLADYLSSLPNTMGQVNEAMEHAAASGLQRLDDGLTSAVAKFLHLHGIAGEFLQDLIKIGIERELLIPLANMLFPQQGASAGLGGGGGGFGSILSSLGSLFGGGGSGSALAGNLGADWGGGGSAFSPSSAASLLQFLPAFATGGSGIIGGNYGTDRNVLSLNGQPFARVNRGEPFAIGPNIGAANGRVNSQPSQVLVVQPIHADFTGARTDEQTMRQFMQYADARSRQAYEAAVSTAAGQAPGVIAQAQTLKG